VADVTRRVFISYRRQPDHALAHLVKAELEKRSFEVEIDIEYLVAGDFAAQIREVIARCDAFVPIVTRAAVQPVAVPPDWMLEELAIAAELKKTIVPFMAQDFVAPAEIEAGWKAALAQHGVRMSSDYPVPSFDKLGQLASGHLVRTWLPRGSAYVVIAAAILGMAVYAFIRWYDASPSADESQLIAAAYDANKPIQSRLAALDRYLLLARGRGPTPSPGLDLQKINLRGGRMTGKDLTRLNLSNADFSDATMNEVNLSGSLLMDARFVGTNLIGANLKDAALNGADLRRAKLGGIQVTPSTSFIHADLCGTWIPENVRTTASFRTSGVNDTRCPDATVGDDCAGHWDPPPRASTHISWGGGGGHATTDWGISNLEEVCPTRAGRD
jgi:hypothetical protein